MSFAISGTQELLSRGLAAVASGTEADCEEAEFYLEWALRSGLDFDGQMDAWLGLARIAKTPEEKRERLENVLAIRPSHPEARLEMAILDGRVKPDEMRANPSHGGQGIEAGGANIGAGEARRFPCPKCGATVNYRPGMGSLGCQFCGVKLDADGKIVGEAPSFGGSDDVNEQDWMAAIHSEKGHAWHMPMSRVLECEACGATVTFAPARVSANCVYCNSPYVVRAAPAGSNLREPDGIVPFALDAPAAGESARVWLRERSGGRAGAPDDLADMAALHDLQPIYLPFWTFDIGGEVRWSGYISDDLGMGSSLHGMDNTMNVGGIGLGLLTGNYEMAANSVANMAQSRGERQNLVYSDGAVPVHLDDVTVPAAASVPSGPMKALQYEVSKAVPYREEFLASWPAEVYTVSMSDASLLARDAAIAASDKDIELFTGEVMGNETVSLRKDRRGLAVLSYKLLLLPAWTAGYTYRGNVYKLLVNGQTGEVEGETPKKEGVVEWLFG